MAIIEVKLPQMGEGIIEARIIRWLVDSGAEVAEDEPIVEIATDKVDSEIPAPTSGKLTKQLFEEGSTPQVGDIIALISNGNESENAKETTFSAEQVKSNGQKGKIPENRYNVKHALEAHSEKPAHVITPFIRHFAQQRGISFDELKTIIPTGGGGELTKQDILNYQKIKPTIAEKYRKSYTTEILSKQSDTEGVKDYVPKEGEVVVELDRTRKIIAERMLQSVHTTPHVTSWIEADITKIVQWRESVKKQFYTDHKINLTYTAIITEIVVQALKKFPNINVSLFGDKLVMKKYVSIGIATALPDGNLIVPVIKNADQINLVQIAKVINTLSNNARFGELKPGDTSGGTFTITNLGQFGNVSGTPIINQPESAILAVGAIKKKPWAIKTGEEYSVGIRDIITFAMSYDHRIIDGALGGAFLEQIAYQVENFDPILL